MRRHRIAIAAAGSLLTPLVALSSPTPATAGFPGRDGRIAYDGYRHGQSDLWSINPDGTGRRQLTDDKAIDADPAYSADGSRIVWSRNGDLWLMHADGTHRSRLTATGAADLQPAFSPTGAQVVWSAGETLHIVNVDGSHAHSLHIDGRWPSWSPNGRWIAYSDVSTYTIDKVHPDGSHKVRLTSPKHGGFDPDWSPSGRRIVFVYTQQPCGACETLLWMVGANGGHRHRIKAPGHFDSGPAFAPDGHRIAFTRHRYDVGAKNQVEVWVYDLQSGAHHAVTTSGLTKHPRAEAPSWQPR